MVIGLWRRGSGAIRKRYVGPPPLSHDPAEQEGFLSQYRLRDRDIADAVNQMLWPRPRAAPPTAVELGHAHPNACRIWVGPHRGAVDRMPFRCEVAPEVQAELAETGSW
jgi:hypothetical protein